eukprot:m.178559 g.178559  ORF g.178559 m.178559 type:complete len:75 (-) comp14927_c0_seq3:332-556(-)
MDVAAVPFLGQLHATAPLQHNTPQNVSAQSPTFSERNLRCTWAFLGPTHSPAARCKRRLVADRPASTGHFRCVC